MKPSLLLLATLSVCAVAHAESPDSVPDPRKTNRSSIYDGAHVLSNAEKRRVDDAINSLEKGTKAQTLVVTVQTLDGASIEDWSNDVFRRIGFGQKGEDNGVLFVFAIRDRKSRIEVGPGLQDRLTDARVGTILRQQIRPAFRAGKYGLGVLNAVNLAANALDGGARSILPPTTSMGSEAEGRATSSQPFRPPSSGSSFPSNNSLPSGGVPNTFSPPSSSGSSSGGVLVLLGLLAVGGIGAMAYAGTRPRRCPRCSTAMNKTEAPDSDLNDAQRCERQIGSRSFTKYDCPKCHFAEIVHHNNSFAGVTVCTRCRNYTAQTHTRTISYPTYDFEGVEEITEECQYPPCRHVSRRERSIPRRVRSSSVAAGGFIGGVAGGMSSGSSDSGSWGSSSGSDSGGSYDGGSSSSYGGGDSDGGGASDSW